MIVAPRFRVVETLNAKDWARPFVARLLEPGLCSYEDSGCGKVLLRKETIDRCIRSFVGRPVVVKQGKKIKARLGRPEFVHAKTSPDNMKEIGHGYVTDVFYDAGDGWWYARGVVDTDEAVAAINKVGKCSCGYKNTGPATVGGLWHDIPYDEEIVEFSGEHLAVVDFPRYEEATIRLNSKNTSGSNMSSFKWIKKLASRVAGGDDAAAQAAAASKAAADKLAADAATKTNAKVDAEDISGETSFDVPTADGKVETVTLAQLIDAHNAKRNSTTDVDGDDEIMCNGKKYKVNALVEAFDKWEKTNSTEEKKKVEDAQNAKADADAKAQAAADAAEKKRLEDATNAKGGSRHFNVLLNARETAPAPDAAAVLNTLEERLARGRSLYGSKKK